MKTYFLDVINRIKRFSQQFNVQTTLCNKVWLVFNDTGKKDVYIFQPEGTVLITSDGIGVEGKWKWVSANNSLVINKDGNVIMLHPEFIDNTILALTLDGTHNMAFLIEQRNKVAFAPKTLAQLEKYFVDKEQKLIADEIIVKKKEKEDRERKEKEDRERKEKEDRERKEKERKDLKEEAIIIAEKFKPKWFETLSFVVAFIGYIVGGTVGIFAATHVWDYLANEPKLEPSGSFEKIVYPIFLFIIQIGLPLFIWASVAFGIMVLFYYIFVKPFEPLAKKQFKKRLNQWHEKYPNDKRYPYITFDSKETNS